MPAPSDNLALNNPIFFTKLCAYRMIIGVLLFAMHFVVFEQPLLGSRDPFLYVLTLLIYTITNTTLLLSCLTWPSLSKKPSLVLASLFIDIGAVYFLKISSADTAAMLPLLLVLVVVVSSMSLSDKMAALTAAMASIAVLVEKVNSILTNNASLESLFDAGAYGTVFFITFVSFNRLAARAQSTETIVSQQAANIIRLEEINEQVVNKMHTGILVLNSSHRISKINAAGINLLSSFFNKPITLSQSIPATIGYHLQEWLSSNKFNKSHYVASNGIQLKLNFSSLGDSDTPSILVFIEDMKQLQQQAQNLKLASLGRLAGSIAHEIRNPLSAISHASQLLNEQFSDDASKNRLIEIINNQSQRIDQIIENVQLLSRRETSNIAIFSLNKLLENIISEYRSLHNTNAEIKLTSIYKNVSVKCDEQQLRQVLNNLIENGLRYSYQHTASYSLEVNLAVNELTELSSVEIIDNGRGIEPKIAAHLFEPFFTSEHNGSGLGLYVARELCEANQLNLAYIKTVDARTCFKISFPHLQKEL
ncbi:MAG: two-component system sensor histidine kinase PilS (NtrC family) [Pseudomonadales bacterium]|jgi:two-component system sensor histidine kinase PilS (NtrC family)